MKDMVILLVHLLTTVAKLLGPGGAKAIIAENLLLKQQLLVVTRSRRRAPNLSTCRSSESIRVSVHKHDSRDRRKETCSRGVAPSVTMMQTTDPRQGNYLRAT